MGLRPLPRVAAANSSRHIWRLSIAIWKAPRRELRRTLCQTLRNCKPTSLCTSGINTSLEKISKEVNPHGHKGLATPEFKPLEDEISTTSLLGLLQPKWLISYLLNSLLNLAEEIFEEIAKIGGMTIKGSRFPPTSSYEDPVAYRNGFTASCVEVEKNLLADLVDEENRIPRLEYPVKPARNQVEPLGVQDTSDDSSDSLQEISADAWNEVQSAIKQAKSGVGPSQKRP
ncbi:uncharacterized protein LOC112520300 isoform X2 [Cynara cardunculus var. scolymus]|uniref:uncharacterized protein LOC112520300 isoform X2 n=1 Tax=Cynara cardunculus var. scolymus TaxID=59895 RepID=UPI000D630051|nr:uncharacterized protein LOC112520300 isoform X2 [Cynara cardunculus var. scolymus]